MQIYGMERLTYSPQLSEEQCIFEINDAVRELRAACSSYAQVHALCSAVQQYGWTESFELLYGENFTGQSVEQIIVSMENAGTGLFAKIWGFIAKIFKGIYHLFAGKAKTTTTSTDRVRSVSPRELTTTHHVPAAAAQKCMDHVAAILSRIWTLACAVDRDIDINLDAVDATIKAHVDGMNAALATISNAYDKDDSPVALSSLGWTVDKLKSFHNQHISMVDKLRHCATRLQTYKDTKKKQLAMSEEEVRSFSESCGVFAHLAQQTSRVIELVDMIRKDIVKSKPKASKKPKADKEDNTAKPADAAEPAK